MTSVGTLPQYVIKLEETIEQLSQQLKLQQKTTEQMLKQMKYIEKTSHRLIEKEKKQHEKSVTPSIKKGFTRPVQISDVLAKFMNMPIGTHVSRTDATKFVMQYIKEKALENPSNRRQIWPDDALWGILGEMARKEEAITHFNLQKYMSVHFTQDAKDAKDAATIIVGE